ncbi:MAG: hypothetical protein QOK35_605 [Pseudonocardiales bacterium]|nr:hypothetical protein [Pseudonocardiales bacterium]
MPAGFHAVPDWTFWENQGAAVAVADLDGNGTADLVVLTVDDPGGHNRGRDRGGRTLAADGAVPGGWTAWAEIPDWFSWANQGCGIAVVDRGATRDLVVLLVDDPGQQNRGVYRLGRDLRADGVVAGGWTPWTDVPDWTFWDNAGAGIAVADLGDGGADLVVFTVDDPVGQNRGLYRIGHGLDAAGVVNRGWSDWEEVPDWFSWENQGAGVAVSTVGGVPTLTVLMVDAPPGQNAGLYTRLPLDEDPATHGRWELLPYSSQVLAIHAATLPGGKVMFFAGSGNNQVRDASHDYGDVAKGIYTSVVWDPAAPTPTFTHPATVRGPDGKPFDFFCGGDTFLPDGTLLSAGGNLAYPGDGHGNLGRADCLGFDPVAGQWRHLGKMAHGRWYPTLLPLQDGRVLAVSGLNDTDGTLNPTFEVYDPGADQWHELDVPQGGLFFGMPLYAHLFLLRGGRVLFTGGRMDDPSPQGPVTLDLTTHPVTITGVPGLDDPVIRNQSASVLLPPAQDQRFMVLGGGPEDASNATGSTSVIDMREADPQFRPGAAMSLPRMHLNAVLLPDRTVFVSGGALAREERVVARLESEIYDPATDTWRIGATASIVRLYHSVALLLPDGRVVAAGGNPPPYGDQVAWEPQDENEELRLEVYSPPYLFAGPRPVITAVPTEWAYGQPVEIGTAADVRWLSLIRPGSTTHAFDNSQRLVDLPVTGRTGAAVRTSAPAQATVAPPGWYMLFLVDAAGVPSVASWVHLH